MNFLILTEKVYNKKKKVFFNQLEIKNKEKIQIKLLLNKNSKKIIKIKNQFKKINYVLKKQITIST